MRAQMNIGKLALIIACAVLPATAVVGAPPALACHEGGTSAIVASPPAGRTGTSITVAGVNATNTSTCGLTLSGYLYISRGVVLPPYPECGRSLYLSGAYIQIPGSSWERPPGGTITGRGVIPAGLPVGPHYICAELEAGDAPTLRQSLPDYLPGWVPEPVQEPVKCLSGDPDPRDCVDVSTGPLPEPTVDPVKPVECITNDLQMGFVIRASFDVDPRDCVQGSHHFGATFNVTPV